MRLSRCASHNKEECPTCGTYAYIGSHDLAAPDGPVCACGKPSTHESGWCGIPHTPCDPEYCADDCPGTLQKPACTDETHPRYCGCDNP